MKTNKAHATWQGTLKEGKGTLKLDTSGQELSFTFSSRFEDGKGSNPEELIGAAHAGCFSMAFSGLLSKNGYEPKKIETAAEVKIIMDGEGFVISESNLETRADIPEIGKEEFNKLAQEAKENCPVSQALSSVKISLNATLI